MEKLGALPRATQQQSVPLEWEPRSDPELATHWVVYRISSPPPPPAPHIGWTGRCLFLLWLNQAYALFTVPESLNSDMFGGLGRKGVYAVKSLVIGQAFSVFGDSTVVWSGQGMREPVHETGREPVLAAEEAAGI